MLPLNTRKQAELWTEYLQGATGIRELATADTRSVHPGLWNDHWELPIPYVERERIGRYPKNLTYDQLARETIPKARTLVERIEKLCITSQMYGFQTLLHLERGEHERRAMGGSVSD